MIHKTNLHDHGCHILLRFLSLKQVLRPHLTLLVWVNCHQPRPLTFRSGHQRLTASVVIHTLRSQCKDYLKRDRDNVKKA